MPNPLGPAIQHLVPRGLTLAFARMCGRYFVTRGTLDVFLDDITKPPVASLRRGDYFGEGVLVGQFRCSASIIAKEYSECVLLLASDFERITAAYPEVVEHIRREREARMQQNEVAQNLMKKLERQATDRRGSCSKGRGRRFSNPFVGKGCTSKAGLTQEALVAGDILDADSGAPSCAGIQDEDSHR
jgi:CRP-like cAMP-binding protein